MADETRGERIQRLTGAIRGSGSAAEAAREIAGMAPIESLYCLSCVCGKLHDRPHLIGLLTSEIGALLEVEVLAAARDNTGVISEDRRA